MSRLEGNAPEKRGWDEVGNQQPEACGPRLGPLHMLIPLLGTFPPSLFFLNFSYQLKYPLRETFSSPIPGRLA